jgi:tRNA 2-thiouridine synthesizing protein A
MEKNMSITSDQVLDCSGMACPMPILKTKKAIDGLQIGQILKMIATDPGSTSDMDAWTKKTGHTLVGSEQADGKYIFYIKKTK